MKQNDESSKEQLAIEVLALVERFHTPATHDHEHARLARAAFAQLAVPMALEGLALLSFAHQLRAGTAPLRDADRAATPRSGPRVRPAPPVGAFPRPSTEPRPPRRARRGSAEPRTVPPHSGPSEEATRWMKLRSSSATTAPQRPERRRSPARVDYASRPATRRRARRRAGPDRAESLATLRPRRWRSRTTTARARRPPPEGARYARGPGSWQSRGPRSRRRHGRASSTSPTRSTRR